MWLSYCFHSQLCEPFSEVPFDLPIKAKSFRNAATYLKLWGGFHHQPPPPLPCKHDGVMNLRVRPRVKMEQIFSVLLGSLDHHFDSTRAVTLMQGCDCLIRYLETSLAKHNSYFITKVHNLT